MALRLELQNILRNLLGSAEVYFQPPTNVQMQYPAIVYKLDDISVNFADNRPYSKTRQYQITLIHADPDNSIIDLIGELPMTTFDRSFVADNLNHYVFNTYF